MLVTFSKNFIKRAKKLSPDLRQKLYVSIHLFSEVPLHPTLRNHQLKGKYKLHRSIDVTGDLRAIYLQQGDDVIFDNVGTHSQLYG